MPLVSKFDEETVNDVRTLMTALGFVERRGNAKKHMWMFLPDDGKSVQAIQFFRMNRSGISAWSEWLEVSDVESLSGVKKVQKLTRLNGDPRPGARLTVTSVRSFQHIAVLLARKLR